MLWLEWWSTHIELFTYRMFLLCFYPIILCFLVLITIMCIEPLIGTFRLHHSSWLTCQSVVWPWLSLWSKSVQMRAAFSHFKAGWYLLAANLQPRLASPLENPQWPARSLYGPRGGTARLDGRSKRQFHIWHALSPRRARAASIPILSWILIDGAPSFLTRGASPSWGPPSSHSSSSACQRPNMAEGRDGGQCWGLWMVEAGYIRWTGSTEDCSWFSSSTGWVILSEPQTLS